MKQEKSFEVLKKRFIIELVLVALDLDKMRIKVEVEVSDYAIISCILSTSVLTHK